MFLKKSQKKKKNQKKNQQRPQRLSSLPPPKAKDLRIQSKKRKKRLGQSGEVEERGERAKYQLRPMEKQRKIPKSKSQCLLWTFQRQLKTKATQQGNTFLLPTHQKQVIIGETLHCLHEIGRIWHFIQAERAPPIMKGWNWSFSLTSLRVASTPID